MAHDVELREVDYLRIPLKKPSKKIKFKEISFKNISSRWNKFKLEKIMKKRLESKKEKLVRMEFSSDQLKPGKSRNRVEKKIRRKTQAIAKLESIINFLENGEYHSSEFIDSRAIKLKSTMMENLVHNSNSAYSVKEDTAQEIMSEQSYSIINDEESRKIGERVSQILAENKAKKNAEVEVAPADVAEGEHDFPNTPIPDETTSQLSEKESMETEKANNVSSDEVAEAINDEMNKIKVSGNESSTAKINRFINEDGTYRLKREDMDEDFRITRFDRSQLEEYENPINIDISPFNDSVEERKKLSVDPPRKALTKIVEPKFQPFPEIVPPTIKEPMVEENAERSMPIITPDRSVSEQVQDEATVEQENDDPNALIARINLLIEEQKRIDAMEVEMAEKSQSVGKKHQLVMEQLSTLANAIEADCNNSYERVNEIKSVTDAKEAEIEAMLEIMAGVQQQETVRRVK